MAVVSTVQQVGISISLGLGISRPLAVVAVSSISIRISIAVGMAVVSTVQQVGISLGLSISGPLAVVGEGGDDGGVLVDDGLAESVGDDGAGANSQGALAGVVDLGVEGGGSEDGGDLMDGSLQVTVVTGNGLVASDSDGDSSVYHMEVWKYGSKDLEIQKNLM